jgi:hypothetical protein
MVERQGEMPAVAVVVVPVIKVTVVTGVHHLGPMVELLLIIRELAAAVLVVTGLIAVEMVVTADQVGLSL